MRFIFLALLNACPPCLHSWVEMNVVAYHKFLEIDGKDKLAALGRAWRINAKTLKPCNKIFAPRFRGQKDFRTFSKNILGAQSSPPPSIPIISFFKKEAKMYKVGYMIAYDYGEDNEDFGDGPMCFGTIIEITGKKVKVENDHSGKIHWICGDDIFYRVDERGFQID